MSYTVFIDHEILLQTFTNKERAIKAAVRISKARQKDDNIIIWAVWGKKYMIALGGETPWGSHRVDEEDIKKYNNKRKKQYGKNGSK